MSNEKTRADSYREYLTGATADGGAQTVPSASLGNRRSSTEVGSLAIEIHSAVSGAVIQHAAEMNGVGEGVLEATDPETIVWTPPGEAVGGDPVVFDSTGLVKLVEGTDPSKFLRVKGTTPFNLKSSSVILSRIVNNVFGFSNVVDADATAGKNYYRATIVKNVSVVSAVYNFKRWLGELGTFVFSDTTQLGGAGAGTIVTTTGDKFADWPKTGWARIVTSAGALREVVYYASRTNTTLTIPAAGRGRFGTVAAAGATTDSIHSVPGIAIALDTNGVQSGGAAIATIANENTAPGGVTWNTDITSSGGLSVPLLLPGQAIGIWMWRQIPAGAIVCPRMEVRFNTSFDDS